MLNYSKICSCVISALNDSQEKVYDQRTICTCLILKCNIGSSEGQFWRFGGISTFKELFFLSFFFS